MNTFYQVWPLRYLPFHHLMWEKYLKRFENLILALDIKDDTRKRALLLHYIGEQVVEIFDTLPNTGDAKDYKKACHALNEYFSPKKNLSYEIFKFGKTVQSWSTEGLEYKGRA